MIILAFDTCLDKMYVTLSINDEIKASNIIETTESHYHSAFLISTIKSVLKNSSITPKEVDVIATNVGPGSFTGIRACNTVARVFAQETGAKTVGISSLEILSRLSNKNSQSKVLVALDARKDMAYVAIYENQKEIFSPKAVFIDEVKDIISKENYNIITDKKMSEVFGGKFYLETDSDLGQILIEIAKEKLSKEPSSDEFCWKNLHPLYIQPPPVTTKK